MLILVLVSSAWGQDTASKIARANDLYLNRNYTEAAALYEELIQKDFHNGYLYYNLGNAYMRQGKTGPAILNYLRAETWIPRDENLDANLRFALQKTEDNLYLKTGGWLKTLIFWVDDLNASEHLKLLLGANFLFFSSLIGWTLRRSDSWNLVRKILLLLLILTAAGTGIKFYTQDRDLQGVILAKQVDVKSGQGESNVTLFQLHEGAVVKIRREQNGWVEIEIPGDPKGWVPREKIGI